MCRYRSRIKGLFHAITRPTVISTIISEGAFQEKLFNSKCMYVYAYKYSNSSTALVLNVLPRAPPLEVHTPALTQYKSHTL